MEQMEMTIKFEMDAAATSAVHLDSEIGLNHLRGEAGLLQSVKSKPALSMKEEILEDGTQTATMEQMEMSIKTEAEKEATFAAHSSSEMDHNFLKQNPKLLLSVKSEPSFSNDSLSKEEFLEDSTQDDSEQQCVYGPSIPASIGGVNKGGSTSLVDLRNVKYESAEMDIGPTVLQHMDTHYTIKKSAATQKYVRVDDYNESMPIKKENIKNKLRDDSEQQCAEVVSTGSDTGSLYEANSLSHGDCVIVKQELEDIDIGPTVLQHMDIHYALNKNTVDGCNQAMRSSGKKKSVDDKSTGNMTKYDFCNQKCCLGQRKSLQHLLRQHQTTSSNCFICDACGKTFRKPHLLSAHRKLHEGNSATYGSTSSSVVGSSNVNRSEAAKTEPKPFKCDISEKEEANLSSSEANLSAHKRFHSGVSLSVCHICSAKFDMKSKLTTHLRTHTGEKHYQCDTCLAKFTTSSQLIIHKRVHSGEKPYQCDTCHARFADSRNLTRHKRVHTGEKPYQCNTCKASFTQSADLTKHKRVHSGEKPYQCDTCDARFTTNSHLTTHKRVHTGEKPYQCTTCNTRFATSGGLTSHKRLHTGEKPYQCDICNARFTTSSHLTTHKRVHTGRNLTSATHVVQDLQIVVPSSGTREFTR